MVFIWYGARFTPDRAVLVRIASSILSDLVWIPCGLLVWTGAFAWLLKQVFRSSKTSGRIVTPVLVFSAAVLFFIFFYDAAFAFFFIPLAGLFIGFLLHLARKKITRIHLSYYIPIACILILMVIHYRWQMIPNSFMGSQPDDIKVMSYNIYSHAGYEDRLRVIETIKRESPDVVCFMEYNPMRDPQLIKQELGDRFPYMLIADNLTRWTRSAALILSRFPLKKINASKVSDKDDRHVNFIFGEMEIDGRRVNIVNYHLITVGHRIARVARANINDREKVNEAAGTETEIDQEKYEQAHYLVDKIATFREPTILCGDLNDTPNSKAFHLLASRLVNTFSAKGWGLGDTFGKSWIRRRFEKIPFIRLFARDVMRIDHIFVSRDITVVSANVVKNAEGSDHKPLIAVLRIP